jgi:nicotinamidase-related amidase
MQDADLVNDAIVIVIDMIKDVVEPDEEFHLPAARTMVPKLREVLIAARRHGIPIVHAASQNMNNSLIERHWWQVRARVASQRRCKRRLTSAPGWAC